VDPTVALVRRWAVHWLSGRDPLVCADILAPGYSLLIGGFLLDGRETYVTKTLEQLDRFPGLGLTVHELVAAPGHVALRFTEHGPDSRKDGQPAAWQGVALFTSDGRHLTAGYAEEDYLSRRRQLAAGTCDPIEPPAPAPWSTPSRPPDPEAEAVVRDWLDAGHLTGVDRDDHRLGHDVTPVLEDSSTTVALLFSAGDHVAFSAALRGRYAGGFPGRDAAIGAQGTLHVAGLVRVRDGHVAGGTVIGDRLGLYRALPTAVAR
jgi:hypothetical protein